MHSCADTECGTDPVSGQAHRPYLNQRTQLYRFSCDDYHSGNSDTLAFDDTCRFGSGAKAGAVDTIDDDYNYHERFRKMQSPSSPPPPPSSSSSSTTTTTSSLATAQRTNELVPTNVIDLATDNLPAVDTPDACDKAALR